MHLSSIMTESNSQNVSNKPVSRTTLGVILCRDGVVLGADRRWTIATPSGLPVYAGEMCKIDEFMKDSAGRSHFVVCNTGAASVSEYGLVRIFRNYLPDYLRQNGIDLEGLTHPDMLCSVLKGFGDYLYESRLWELLYRDDSERMSQHLIVFRNDHFTDAYFILAFMSIIPIRTIRPVKSFMTDYRKKGTWLTCGSGSSMLNSVLCVQDYTKPFYERSLLEATDALKKGFYSATSTDFYSNPGVVKNAKTLDELKRATGSLDEQGNKDTLEIDLVWITKDCVTYTPTLV